MAEGKCPPGIAKTYLSFKKRDSPDHDMAGEKCPPGAIVKADKLLYPSRKENEVIPKVRLAKFSKNYICILLLDTCMLLKDYCKPEVLAALFTQESFFLAHELM